MKTVFTALVVIVVATIIFAVVSIGLFILLDVLLSSETFNKHYTLIRVASVFYGGLAVWGAYKWAIAKNL